jgi:hypothetical protein
MAANPMTSAPLFFFRNFHKKCDGSCTCDVLQTGVGRSTYGVSHKHSLSVPLMKEVNYPYL